MNLDLEVDVPGVRGCASGLAETAARVAGGVGGLPDPVPGWATSDAVSAVGDVARHRLALVGADIAATAQQIIAAVIDYQAADERVAARLRSLR